MCESNITHVVYTVMVSDRQLGLSERQELSIVYQNRPLLSGKVAARAPALLLPNGCRDSLLLPKMNLARILNEAVGSWLHFEFSCNRSGLFNEKYLSYPIGQVLSARFGDRVHAEFTHPVLAPVMRGRGRRPQVDFAYCSQWPIPNVAVETKWIGRTKVTVEDIIWDLVRLEMIAHTSGATCVFILGGRRRDLEFLFGLDAFSGAGGPDHSKPILSTNSNSRYGLWLLPRNHNRIPTLKKLFRDFQDIEIPHFLSTVRSAPFPPDPPATHYQVYSWRVYPMVHRETFLPRDNRHYRA